MRFIVLVLLCLPPAVEAAELKQKTLSAFGEYVRATEAAFDQRREQGQLLFFDKRPEFDLAAVKQGRVLVEKRAACLNGRPVEIPDAIVHDWTGIIFIPGVTPEDVLRLAQDIPRHKDIYRSEVISSKLLSREGDRYLSEMRVMKKKVITVVLDMKHDNKITRWSPQRASLKSRTLSIEEVENWGKPNERKLPPSEGHGFLWRLYSYWNLEQRDGGTYVEIQALSLTRDIPFGLGAIIKPFLEGVPRESLCNTLTSTRRAVLNQSEAATKQDCVIVSSKNKSEACTP